MQSLDRNNNWSPLKIQALELYLAGVKAADPEHAVDRFLADNPLDLPKGGKCHIIAFGKAAIGMMIAALRHVPTARTGQKLVVTNYENDAVIEGVQVMLAGHPIPDAAGAAAARAVESAVLTAGPNDMLLVLISGGGSALLPAPVEGISLDDKIAVNRVLLGCGANIQETNLVRQSLSRLKGGGLARLAYPTIVQTLVLSDVIGDDLRFVASGPTAEPAGSRADAVTTLKHLDVFDQIPASVRQVLAQPCPRQITPCSDAISIVGSNAISLSAMLGAAQIPARIVCSNIIQNVDEAAAIIADHAQSAKAGEALLFGGETTVTLRGNGVGGRNQELALRFALIAERIGIEGPWVFLSGGTDGRDGPTDSAGACVDDDTLQRIRQAGGDPEAYLADNDSFHALLLSGDHINKWPSGTNVADVQVFIKQKPRLL